MDTTLIILGLILAVFGVLSSFLPILPDIVISWVALLLIHLTKAVPDDWWFLGITAAIVAFITAMDYIIPAIGTKKFGGTKAGMVGTTIGLVIGIISPIPGGIIIGAFIGAFIGELSNKTDNKTALKAAFGSFLGFLAGTFIKFITTSIFLGLFLIKVWEYREALLSQF